MQKDDRLVPAWPTHDDSEQQGGTSREVVAMEEAEDQDGEEQGIVPDTLSDFIISHIEQTINAKEDTFKQAQDTLYNKIKEIAKKSVSEEISITPYYRLEDYHYGVKTGVYTIVVNLSDILSEHLPVIVRNTCESLWKKERIIDGFNFTMDYSTSSDDKAISSIKWSRERPKDNTDWSEQLEKYKSDAQAFYCWFNDLINNGQKKSIKVELILKLITLITPEEVATN